MKKSILFMLFLLSISYSVFGQITVSGRVIDNYGEPVIGIIIKVKDTLQGTVTDIDGKFIIEVKDENTILIFERHNMTPLELKASVILAIKGEVFLFSDMDCILTTKTIAVYEGSLDINYWSGIFYNPYGIMISKGFYSKKEQENRKYFLLGAGYSTNFKSNSDFYGGFGTDAIGRYMYYIFQQTTFNKSETENRITTHFIGSSSNLKFIKTSLSYGIGHQIFSKTGIENNKTDNYGIRLGLSKRIKYIGAISAKSFYWQDYWAWEANITKDFKRKIHTSISYRQTTQDFKEINLTLGYIF
ncbi:carboxypeptidase-like regulatory domain-containing protein [Bernardetia sp. OM2101]|uniref:carboxypeptidase-like regulatory domain-containing protein n=1 Tax=Bernardetia sp. OM2101 TaxID=3344876 RepID=UPI0035CF5F3B